MINGVARRSEFLEVLGENTSSAIKWNSLVGQAGEAAAGITGPKTAIVIAGRTRVPDELSRFFLKEVKNVKYQGLTSQLKDFINFAQQTGRQFILYTRSSTIISKPLQGAIDQGLVERQFIR